MDTYPTLAAYNKHLRAWIMSQGDYHAFPQQKINYDSACTFAKPLEWMQHTQALDKETIALLNDLLRYRHTDSSYYITRPKEGAANPTFLHEPEYPDMLYPAKPYRLLALARYWNMIEYFFPYKYVTDIAWHKIPALLIPEFTQGADTLAYYNTLRRMTAKVNDSHASVRSPKGFTYARPWHFLPVELKMIESKAVITYIYNDSFAKANDLRKGDVLLSLDDTGIAERIKQVSPRLSASNDAVIRRDAMSRIVSSEKATIAVACERNGKTDRKMVPLADNGIPMNYLPDTGSVWNLLPGNIGYVHTGRLKPQQVDLVFDLLKTTNGLVLDVRTYPQWTLFEVCKKLSADSLPFVKFTYADFSYPGAFGCQGTISCGIKRPDPYKGRIAILVNEQTQSRAEYTTMAFQTLPQAKVVGSQTAGADGNVSSIVLPGGYSVWMTGLGVYYPDGKVTQRIGIVPDIPCSPTVAGFRSEKDEVLERAVKYIQTGK